MRNDVYDAILSIAEQALLEIQKSNDYLTLATKLTVILTGIIGICGGAKAAEKKER